MYAVISSENIESRSTLTPTEHIKGLTGVDVASTGLNQSNVVVRGFNNIFSGALLVLTEPVLGYGIQHASESDNPESV